MKHRRRASNPVVRAVAMAQVRSLLLLAKIKVFSFEDGEDQSAFMVGVVRNISLVAMAAERQWAENMPPEVEFDLRVVRGGVSAITQTLFKWDSAQAVAIEQCLVRVERLNGLLKIEHVMAAHLDILQIDAQHANPTPP